MGRRAGGSGVWVLIAFLAIGYWVYGEAQRKERVARERIEAGAGPVAVRVEPEAATTVARGDGAIAVEIDERESQPPLAPERPLEVAQTPSQSMATASASCVLSSGAFALPVGTQSVDWKIVNRAVHDVDIEVTVYRLRIGDAAEVVPPGVIRKTLPPGHETHNANSVGAGRPFPPGSDFEVVVRRSDRGALPSVSFWSDRGNSEIPGTRIGPRDFVAVAGDCGHD